MVYLRTSPLLRIQAKTKAAKNGNKIKKAIMRATTDSDGEVRFDVENKPGISNLLNIYSVLAGKSVAELETMYEGKGYGDFKPAVGEAVISVTGPIRDEAQRILKDKAYLESVYKAGAEKASYIAEKTLRKVYKKIGFVPR